MVAQLLREFVGGPGGAGIDLADLDLDGMKRLNAKFHADTGQRREGDMIWRIPRHDGSDTFLLLLLEFQSTSDQYMALRVLTYAGLLWQQLVSEGELGSGGKLPPQLPLVVYNGEARWRRGTLAARHVGARRCRCASLSACRTLRRCGAGSRICVLI